MIIPKPILITHAVNPHQFYFKYFNDSVNSEFSKFDFEIQLYGDELYALKKYEDGYAPAVNELVIFFHLISNKWIRGRVISIDQEIILWCLDWGIKEKCSAQHVLPLTPRFHEDMKLVHLAGLSLLPTEKIFNNETLDVETQLSEQWDEKIINNFKSMVNSSKSFMFTEELVLQNHIFGSLSIESKAANKKVINNILLKISNVAPIHLLDVEDLRTYVNKDKLEKHLYESLTDISKVQVAKLNSVRCCHMSKCSNEMSLIENSDRNKSYEDFNDAARRQSSDSTMLDIDTKSCRSSIIDHHSSKVEVPHKNSSIKSQAEVTSSVSNSESLENESYNDFNDSVSMALSSADTTDNTENSEASTASSYLPKRSISLFDHDHECYLNIRKIDRSKRRPPLPSTINYINSQHKRASMDNNLSQINESNLNAKTQPPRTLPIKNRSTTRSIRNIAKLDKKEPIAQDTKFVNNNSRNTKDHYGVPAGYAKDCLKTFGGITNKN